MISNSCSKDSSDENTTGNNTGNNGPAANEVSIQGMAFTPSSITVTVGTTVKWTNKESIVHTVTSNTGIFNSGNIALNGVFSYTFNTAGSFPYHCTIHPSMTGTVTVNAATSGTTSY
jgi:plastocyanin